MVDSRAVNKYKEPYDIYIGRGSKWGNPYAMKDRTLAERDRVCDLYEIYFWTTDLPMFLYELIGKRLGCFCKGLRCHGDFLASEANKVAELGQPYIESKLKDKELVSMIRNPNKVLTYPVVALPESFVVMDFETTGLDPEHDRIIEIGAVRFTRGEPIAMFNCMVKQDPDEYPMSAKMTEITGHTSEDVARGLDEERAIATLIEFMDDRAFPPHPLVGQNILFDYAFLTEAAGRYGWELVDDLIDTLTIARDRKPYPHKLPDLCHHYGIVQDNWHSAYYDALATGEVLLAMHAEDMNYEPTKQVIAYTNIIGFKRQYGEPMWKPDWVTLKGQGTLSVKEGVAIVAPTPATIKPKVRVKPKSTADVETNEYDDTIPF
jgi:DNA polymerase-3 subunit epsilon